MLKHDLIFNVTLMFYVIASVDTSRAILLFYFSVVFQAGRIDQLMVKLQ